jgi:pSer/pThr/pTyr-binding forkhead associated (FHA) protein
MRPLGGGDPIPLKKDELTIGRRPTCDIQLDFENVSSKHCVMRFDQGVWHVRDLGSTNGTTLNGQKVTSEQAVLPTDELVIATHPFRIDYEPSGPLPEADLGDDRAAGSQKQPSLLELAGFESGGRPKPPTPPQAPSPPPPPRQTKQPTTPIARPKATEADFEDVLPQDFQAPPPKTVAADDDDFFKLIEDEVK